MRDIPVFVTELGVASLTLKEIAYRQEAYIRIQDTRVPQAFLDECVSFCRGAGAETVFATGHEIVGGYPLHTEVWEMRCQRERLMQTRAALFPVQAHTKEHWRQIYNDRMRNVPNAATMTLGDSETIVQRGYFVHADGELLGIGMAAGDTLDAVASVVPGAGQDVVAALCGALTAQTVRVEVASANLPAVRLYERLGFLKTRSISQWHRVL